MHMCAEGPRAEMGTTTTGERRQRPRGLRAAANTGAMWMQSTQPWWWWWWRWWLCEWCGGGVQRCEFRVRR